MSDCFNLRSNSICCEWPRLMPLLFHSCQSGWESFFGPTLGRTIEVTYQRWPWLILPWHWGGALPWPRIAPSHCCPIDLCPLKRLSIDSPPLPAPALYMIFVAYKMKLICSAKLSQRKWVQSLVLYFYFIMFGSSWYLNEIHLCSRIVATLPTSRGLFTAIIPVLYTPPSILA